MDMNISYCGYDCSKCAAMSDDKEVRQQLVDAWKKVLGHTMYDAENVHCCGCKTEGHHADSQCQARPCAIERNLDSCAECDDFPCRKVAGLISGRNGLSIFCHRGILNATEEEFRLAVEQFTCSQENLVKRLKELGKLPGWFK